MLVFGHIYILYYNYCDYIPLNFTGFPCTLIKKKKKNIYFVGVDVCYVTCGGQRPEHGSCSLFPPYGFQRLNSNHQAWHVVP